MSEDQDTQEQESSESEKPAGPVYFVHNTSRSRHNRVQRYAAASHRGLKQHLGGGAHRIIRGRPAALSEEHFMKHLDEIKEKVKAGLLEVRTSDGRKVDVDTLEIASPSPTVPLPNFPLDSAALDKNKGIGEVIPPYVGDDQSSMPVVLPPGQLPQVLQKKAEEEQAAAEADAAADLNEEDAAAIERAISDSGDAPKDTEVVSSGKKSRRNK